MFMGHKLLFFNDLSFGRTCNILVILMYPDSLVGNRDTSKCCPTTDWQHCLFNCFIHKNECLALYVWKINLTNEYRLLKCNSEGLQIDT